MTTTRKPAPEKSRFVLRSPRALEYQEQTALFDFAKVQARSDPRWDYLFAIPNGTSASSMAEAIRAKKTGRKRGIPDVFLPVPQQHGDSLAHGLFIELKRQGGVASDVSAEQRAWMNLLNAQGYRAVVAYGWQDAVAAIQAYLSPVTGEPGP
jgi:hypothetical protein